MTTETTHEMTRKAETKMAKARELGLSGKTEAQTTALREARELYFAAGNTGMVERIERRLQAAGN